MRKTSTQLNTNNIKNCSIPTVYCGTHDGTNMPKSNSIEYHYTKRGTPYECLKKGYGAGMHNERSKTLSKKSLQNIRYVGEVYEKNFANNGINDIPSLISYCNSHLSGDIKRLLSTIFTKKSNLTTKVIDKKAYNSTLLYLYGKSVSELPQCYKL